jgi:aspartyl-tRNA(Asn)/glutamyl-tRNA(Gln) amidotransferase subunit C
MMPDDARRVQPASVGSPTRVVPSGVATRLTRTDVERIAALAHLELTESETELFTRQLGDILSYFDRLQQIDTTGVPATTHPVTSSPVMRADDPRPSMPRDDALANAPDPGGDGLFRVPKVIG